MSKNRFLNHLLVTTIICGAAVVATPVYAQDARDQDEPSTGPVENIEPDVSAQGESLDGEGGEAIVVTGSRIPQPNLTAVSPVTVINSQEVKLQGTTRTEDLVNSLPQAFAGQGGNLANGATGTANINLRGLGSERTLVLVNGRRLLPGDPSSSAADINFIPTGIVKRVDVLTGGASSVYGSDAVSGVVNFIMDTDFEGLRLDAQYSFFQHDNDSKTGIIDALNRRGFGYPRGSVADGGTVNFDASFGASFDDGRGRVVAYAGYRELEAVTQDRRDYSACASQARATETILDCGGSATSANGTFFTNVGTFQIGSGRNFIPGSTPYNFAPTNYYQRPDERYTFGAFAEYEISEAVQPYMEAMFMDDRTVAQIAPSGNFGNTFNINCNNPLLSAQQLAIACAPANIDPDGDGVIDQDDIFFGNLVGQVPILADPTDPTSDVIGFTAPTLFSDTAGGADYIRGILQPLRRNVEGGGRQDDLQHTSYRIVGGVRGDISSAFSYDAYYLYGRVNFAQTYFNDFSVSRLTRALDVVTGPDGTPVCRSVLDGSDLNCVPYDIFAPGQVSAAAISYLQVPGFTRGQNEQRVASASVTGLLGEYGLQSPWAEEGLGVNVGVEYRKDSLNFDSDVSFQTGDLAGQGAPTLPVSGSFTVQEVFGEARLPIIENSFIENLSFEAGYRYSRYNIGGSDSGFTTDTYKFGVDFAPIRDIRIRASYNRAVRAPNIQELFAPNRVALNGNADPCAGILGDTNPDGSVNTANDPEATAAQCALTGVTAGQYGNIQPNPAGQYNGFIGGNTDLQPEKATTKSIGLVLQPRFLPGFAATIDYFDIEIKDAIQQIGQDTIINTCIDTGDETFCNLINRDAFGSLWRSNSGFVIDTDQNIGGASTKGIDVGVSYATEIGSLGSLGFNIVGTYLDELITDNGVSDAYDCAKFYGLICGTPNPEWRHKARVSYTSPEGIGLSVQWRYFDAVKLDRTSSQPTLAGAFSPFNEKLPSQSFFDLAGTFRVSDNYTFRLGVQNIFDNDPPIIGSNGTSGVINACPSVFCSGNTFPQVYDALGRYIYAGVTLDF